MSNSNLPAHKCHPGHCLCNAMSTIADSPQIDRRIQAYSDRWEYITWHVGDAMYYSYWRPDGCYAKLKNLGELHGDAVAKWNDRAR